VLAHNATALPKCDRTPAQYSPDVAYLPRSASNARRNPWRKYALPLSSRKEVNRGSAMGDTSFGDDELRAETATLVFADIVESARLIDQNEAETVKRIRALLTFIVRDVLPNYDVELVEHRGDGLLLRGRDALACVRCGFAVLAHVASQHVSNLVPISMRIAVHRAEIWADDERLYGAGLNVASRIVSLAEPDQIVVSAALKEAIPNVIGIDAEDLGECYLRNIEQPIHCYRLRVLERAETNRAILPVTSPLPKLAVAPFACPDHGVSPALARVFTSLLTATLSKSHHLRVVSALSMQALSESAIQERAVVDAVNADWVVSGTLASKNDAIQVRWRLKSQRGPQLECDGSNIVELGELFSADSQALIALGSEILSAMLGAGESLASCKPLRNLPSNIVLLSAIACMHRGGLKSDALAAQALDELMERHKRNAIPFAWAAKRTFLRMWRGWSGDLAKQRMMARQYADQSVEKDAATGLPYAIRAMISSHIDRNFSESRGWYDKAIEVDPNEPLIWLFKASLHTFEDEGLAAAEAARRALDLSPLDPISYYFKTLAAGAFLSNGEYALAIELAQRATVENTNHHSSYRVLAIACGLDGQHERGHKAINALLSIDPSFTVTQFLYNSPAVRASHYARVLRELGAPE
jgi:adenylate cyclase